ncbi:MAG: N-acetyltransferase [Nevskia sp.]|nr:N-acetyltransferase [Nevskia sp.]
MSIKTEALVPVVTDISVGNVDAVSDAAVQAKRDTMASSQYQDVIVNQDNYGIRLTDTAAGRNSASMLINKMYAWRGYAGTHQLGDDPNRITLTATDHGETVGTLTIGIDSPIGLLADQIFKAELDAHRERGAKLCEFTKFAFDTNVQSKISLANLFHLAVIYARDIHQCTDILIEVNPRHRRFYEHMLGFKREAELRINPRVSAPAYLLSVNLEYVTGQIQALGGTFSAGSTERSFYPYFFSPREEKGILERLLRVDRVQTQ